VSVTRNSSAYGHRLDYIQPDQYRLSWVIDFKYAGSRLRYPRTFTRDTDLAGAKRFAKKWGLVSP
jgi:hypothetical protein